jgi:uncharacterized membrane protein
MTTKLSTHYKNFFNSIPHDREDILHGLITLLYIVVLFGFFLFIGPFGSIVLGFSMGLSIPLAFLGSPVLGFLLWPTYSWAMDKVTDKYWN